MANPIKTAARGVTQNDGGAAAFAAALATVILMGSQWIFNLDPYPVGMESALATVAATAVTLARKAWRSYLARGL